MKSMVRSSDGVQPLTRLERLIIETLLERHAAGQEALHEQLAQAHATRRTHSGVGFMTRLAVPGEAPVPQPVDEPRLRPLYATHPQLREPAEFMLQLRDGRLNTLEAYCFNGMWPADEAGFRIVD
jgi:hypothetical protein